MDLFDKLNAALEPLGERLFLDAFVSARQSEAARQAAAVSSRKAAARKAPAEPAAPSRETAPIPESGDPQARPVPLAEMEAFMSRDRIEGADEAEVQEFLKERAGYDPTELP